MADSKIEFQVTVQPIITCDENGKNPAVMRIEEKLINQLYRKAGIEFKFLKPVYYKDKDARDGKKNLDTIVKEAKKDGILKGNGKILNMFFVNAVDGKKGPLGRAQQGGRITFISMAEKVESKAQDAFVVAHESGHNLGLTHAVDDKNVADDIPNIMGGGAFEKRVAKDGLTDYQVKIILKSKLLKKKKEEK